MSVCAEAVSAKVTRRSSKTQRFRNCVLLRKGKANRFVKKEEDSGGMRSGQQEFVAKIKAGLEACLPCWRDASATVVGRRGAGAPKILAGDFFQLGLIDVEVGVDVLDVVLIFEGFQQANHGGGLLAFQLHVVLRDHADLGDFRLD